MVMLATDVYIKTCRRKKIFIFAPRCIWHAMRIRIYDSWWTDTMWLLTIRLISWFCHFLCNTTKLAFAIWWMHLESPFLRLLSAHVFPSSSPRHVPETGEWRGHVLGTPRSLSQRELGNRLRWWLGREGRHSCVQAAGLRRGRLSQNRCLFWGRHRRYSPGQRGMHRGRVLPGAVLSQRGGHARLLPQGRCWCYLWRYSAFLFYLTWIKFPKLCMQAGTGERRAWCKAGATMGTGNLGSGHAGGGEDNESQEGWPGAPWSQVGPAPAGFTHPGAVLSFQQGIPLPGSGGNRKKEHFLPEGTTSRFWQTNLESAFGTKTVCPRASKCLCQTCSFINVFSSLSEFVLIFKDLHHIYVKFTEENEENSCQLRMQREIFLMEVLAPDECGVFDPRHQCRLAGHCIFVDSAVSVQEKVRSYREVTVMLCCHIVL